MPKKSTSKNKKSKKTTLKIGTHLFPPLVMKKGDEYEGFIVELWNAIAKELGLKFKYVECQKVQDLFSDLIQKKIDVIVAGSTQTEERERLVDFSHHTFESGLNILISVKTKLKIMDTIRSVFTSSVKKILLLLLGFTVLASHAIWFVERGSPTINQNYFPGIIESFWWSIATVSTVGYGDITPITLLGRLIGIVVILIGLAIFGLYIAKISSAMAVKEIKSSINKIEDLQNKTVATVIGSTSVEVLKKIGSRLVLVHKIEEAYPKLINNEVDAIVFDSPALLFYAHNEGVGKVQIVGKLFEKQMYGIAIRQKSELREKINVTLLHLRENGYYDSLYNKWFGK